MKLKTTIALTVLLFIVLMIYPFVEDTDNNNTLSGLPWQIEVKPDGSTQVFGINIGISRLGDAVTVLGDNQQLAIIAAGDEPGKLEMYYDRYQAGLLSGKLILQAIASDKEINSWRSTAVKSETMPNGRAKKYILSQNTVTQALQARVNSITYIAQVRLDDEVIRARFGKPAELVELEGASHYLYPDRGLDIALFENSKAVFQYVSPQAFEQLLQPLQ